MEITNYVGQAQRKNNSETKGKTNNLFLQFKTKSIKIKLLIKNKIKEKKRRTDKKLY